MPGKPIYDQSKSIRIKESKRQKEKICLMAILLVVCCFLAYYFLVVLGIATVFTHFFYVPIILASLWWKRKGLAVALFLALLLICSHHFLRDDVVTANDYFRALMFVVIGFVVALLSERIAKKDEALKTSELMLLKIIEKNIDSIVIVDAEGVVRFANAAADRLFGRKTGELVGSSFGFPLVKGQSTEITLYTKAGNTKLGEIRKAEIEWEGEKAYLATIRDVTDRKRMEGELQKARKFESIGILSGGFAHDYNNLLSMILGNLSLAQMSVSPEDEAFRFLKEMKKAIMQARDLTKKVLTSAGGGALMKKTALISPLLNKAAERALSESDVRYELSIPDDLWAVEIDGYLIGQVIHNLLLNAVESISARQEGATEVVEPASITVNAENCRMDTQNPLLLKEGKYVKVSIEDNGIGIPHEHLDRVFDPYFSTKERGAQKGMGLGLSLCQSILKSHEGNIIVESKEGAGTTFHMYLPTKGGH